jgi:hypothetical protein
VVFAKQANIANGPQQVNNTVNKSDGGYLSCMEEWQLLRAAGWQPV